MRELYFQPHRDGLQIAPELRSHVVFAHHNLLRDAPFTRIDLVSCRNLLIYLSPSMQRKALTSFHFALKLGGTLLLGPSESPASLGDEFAVVDGRWRLFRKLRDSRILPEVRGASPLRVEPPGGAAPAHRGRTRGAQPRAAVARVRAAVAAWSTETCACCTRSTPRASFWLPRTAIRR